MTQISLPSPVLSHDFTQSRQGTARLEAMHKLGEAQARISVLDALALVTGTVHGANLATECTAAMDARDDAAADFEEHIKDLDPVAQWAQRDRASMTAVEIVAGMVARLIAGTPGGVA